jgi:maltooligosyltrehalose trehalohydrolase
VIDDPEIPRVGAFLLDEQIAEWRVWAPNAQKVELVLGVGEQAERLPMTAEPRGFFSVRTLLPEKGHRYAYALDGEAPRPDPCSRWQPDGVLRPSAVWWPERFAWNDDLWRGIDHKDLVFYELHVGTFTSKGTFAAILGRVPELLDLGITAIELMPIGHFPGLRGWGYDGVHPFAPQNSYGGPEALHRLVDGCHALGMAVFLDVVYNHFGPEGNVFPRFGPYLTDKYRTSWGSAVNYDGPGSDVVRAMVIENARSWIRDYHFDGLRLDASDQVFDHSPRHILEEIVEAVHAEGVASGRRVHAFAETDLNDAPRFLHTPERGGYGLDVQWNDDFHHAVHVVLTGEQNGYYADFHGADDLVKAYERVFVHDGRYSTFRDRRHGAPCGEFSGDRFLAFVQNHDQVGNRMLGDRLATTLPLPKLRLAAGLLLLAPRIPLLFMGEEYGEPNPFPYFCDFENPELVQAVREGRRAEFLGFRWAGEPPDPFDPAVRDASVLSWSWIEPERAGLRRLYQDLIRMRREWPTLRDFRLAHVRLLEGAGEPGVLELVRGGIEPGATPVARAYFNLGDCEPPIALGTVDFRSEWTRYGGSVPDDELYCERLRPYEFVIVGGNDE